MSDRLPPYDGPMEAAIIGCIIQQPDLLNECQTRFKVGADAFYDVRTKTLYAGFCEMQKDGTPIDIPSVFSYYKNSNKLHEIGGIEFLNQCQDSALTSNFEHYAERVSQSYMLRKTLATCTEAASEVYDNPRDAESVISGIETRLQSIREIRQNDLIIGGKRASGLLRAHLEERFDLKGARSGIVTGLSRFDSLTDGLQMGEQTIIGARPSMGKTALATTIIRRACLIDKVPTLVITLEMSIHALCRRILANHFKIPLNHLRHGEYNDGDFRAFASFSSILCASPIFFMDAISGTDADRICAAIRRAAKQAGVKLVVIDYLQKIQANSKHEKRTYEIAQVSGCLKAAAVESGCALLTLAQLNRESEQQKGRQPRLSDLADSAQIERDGDCIALLHRDRGEKPNDASLIIAKQRDGEVGICGLSFDGQFCSFEDNIPCQAESSERE
jgi:replicative DNA helicase